MGVTAQSSPTMNGLLVLSTLAAASAQVVLPYGGLAGYPYGYAGYPYAVAKPVVNEVEVPVPVVQYAAIDTGCKNSFGHAVPCFQEGEARRKRSADEEAAEAAPAVASVLPYGLGLGYHGLGYAGLGYAGLHYPYAVAAPAPVEVEVPVTQYKYVPESRPSNCPPPARTLSALPFPAPKSVVKVFKSQLTIKTGQDF